MVEAERGGKDRSTRDLLLPCEQSVNHLSLPPSLSLLAVKPSDLDSIS